MKKRFYYKINRTNGETYVQIWKRLDDGKSIFMKSCGSAEKLYNVLVSKENPDDQTKE